MRRNPNGKAEKGRRPGRISVHATGKKRSGAEGQDLEEDCMSGLRERVLGQTPSGLADGGNA